MLKLKVKKELLPTRCEICHKEDCYNPDFNFCTRCNQSLTSIAYDVIENMPSKEVLYDWQIITLKDMQIIWLKISLNFFAFLTLICLTPLFGEFILSIPPNMFGIFALGASEAILIFTILIALFSGNKLPEIVENTISFIKSIFL
ncbi:MAG: hypothetical protein HY819_08590 [Acidobacteria bacterium]|nr:hypothetical protein [Acidobacteriota bacterium]